MKYKVHTTRVTGSFSLSLSGSLLILKRLILSNNKLTQDMSSVEGRGKSCCERLKVSSACSTSVYRTDTPLDCWLHGVRKHLEGSTVEAPYTVGLGEVIKSKEKQRSGGFDAIYVIKCSCRSNRVSGGLF